MQEDNMYQKIVIPSGTVRPDQTVIIEIPNTLKQHPLIIARRAKDPNKYKNYAALSMLHTLNDQQVIYEGNYNQYHQQHDQSSYEVGNSEELKPVPAVRSFDTDRLVSKSKNANVYPLQQPSKEMHAYQYPNEDNFVSGDINQYYDTEPEGYTRKRNAVADLEKTFNDLQTPIEFNISAGMNVEQVESKEREALLENLKAFHQARRDVLNTSQSIVNKRYGIADQSGRGQRSGSFNGNQSSQPSDYGVC